METKFSWLSLVIFVTSRFASAVTVKNGHLKVLKKQPGLEQCALDKFNEDEYVGVRIFGKTGQCEGLPFDWALNQTIDDGYGYAQKTFVREILTPPYTVYGFKLPGVFDHRAILDVYVSLASLSEIWDGIWFSGISLQLSDEVPTGRTHVIQFNKIRDRYIMEVTEWWEGNSTYAKEINDKRLSDSLTTMKIVKISFITREKNLTMFVDDVEFFTMVLSAPLNIKQMTFRNLNYRTVYGWRFEFTIK